MRYTLAVWLTIFGALTLMAFAQDGGPLSPPASHYKLPQTGALSADELAYAAACVDAVELGPLATDWAALKSLRARALSVVTTPPTSPPANPNRLVRGLGAQEQVAPQSVAGRAFLPADPLVRTSAVLAAGDNFALPFMLYDNTTAGPIPQELEFSLDGGPWLVTRSGRIVVDGPDGDYQVRVVSWPASGESHPWPPMLLTRRTIAGVPFWSVKP